MIEVKIVLFASLREALDTAETKLQISEGMNVQALISELGKLKGDIWAQTLAAENVLCAINHTMVETDEVLHADDEVAFYPPVTGG